MLAEEIPPEDIDRPEAELLDYAGRHFTPGRPFGDGYRALLEGIRQDFVFDTSATEVTTPLGQVMARRRGVCQDFARLAVSCLRALGLAARYVSGYVAAPTRLVTPTLGPRSTCLASAGGMVIQPAEPAAPSATSPWDGAETTQRWHRWEALWAIVAGAECTLPLRSSPLRPAPLEGRVSPLGTQLRWGDTMGRLKMAGPNGASLPMSWRYGSRTSYWNSSSTVKLRPSKGDATQLPRRRSTVPGISANRPSMAQRTAL